MTQENRAPLGAKRWNEIDEAIAEWFDRTVDLIVDRIMADGYPPFTYPLSPYEQYQKLIAMRDSGDPAFWQNPEAAKDLERLSARFGYPPRRTVGVYGQQSDITNPYFLRQSLE